MKDRNIEKLLYKLAALLVVCGAAVRMLDVAENQLGFHLILCGLMTGLVAIMLHMKYVNDLEHRKIPPKDKELRKQ